MYNQPILGTHTRAFKIQSELQDKQVPIRFCSVVQAATGYDKNAKKEVTGLILRINFDIDVHRKHTLTLPSDEQI